MKPRTSVFASFLCVAAVPAFAAGSIAQHCRALASADLSRVPDAPGRVLRTAVVEATDSLPAYCAVEGYIRPRIRFEARLPLDAWNGKQLMRGCGGFCGSVPIAACSEGLARGYACIATDMGHASTPLDAVWAYNDREAELDFAYRATHATATLGRALVEQFYGRAPRYSYFQGCSTGGRQGLLSAQRFPNDFDGIIAGAPVISVAQVGVQLLWSVRANAGTSGPILDASAVELLRRGALEACDAGDGLSDGIIGDPPRCEFRPADLACTMGRTSGCLTAAQVEAAARIYDGPIDSRGRPLQAGGAPVGSEANWIPNYIGAPGRDPVYAGFMRELFRYLAFAEDPGPSWELDDFDFDRDPPRLGFMDQLFSAANPDLRRYAARGGKLIIYHGWADQSVVPAGTLDYFRLLERTMGGEDRTGEFAKLYMVPGMNHCAGGVGATEVDFLTALETWVEQGKAPNVLVGEHVREGRVLFTRPVVPYPSVVRLRTGSDPRSTDSFDVVQP